MFNSGAFQWLANVHLERKLHQQNPDSLAGGFGSIGSRWDTPKPAFHPQSLLETPGACWRKPISLVDDIFGIRRKIEEDNFFTISYFPNVIQLDWREGDVSGFVHLVRLGGNLYGIDVDALGASAKASFNRAGEEFAVWRPGFLRYMHETYSSEWLKVFKGMKELSPAVSLKTRWAFSLLARRAAVIVEELSSGVPFETRWAFSLLARRLQRW